MCNRCGKQPAPNFSSKCDYCFHEEVTRAERAEALRELAEQNRQIILKHRQLADWASERTEVNARLAAIEAKLDGLAKPEDELPGYGFGIMPPGVKLLSIEVSPKEPITLAPAAASSFAEALSPRGETKDEKSS